MDQPTFADLEYGQKRRKTRREEFLERLETLVPWQRLEERIRPHYFRGERGRNRTRRGTATVTSGETLETPIPRARYMIPAILKSGP